MMHCEFSQSLLEDGTFGLSVPTVRRLLMLQPTMPSTLEGLYSLTHCEDPFSRCFFFLAFLTQFVSNLVSARPGKKHHDGNQRYGGECRTAALVADTFAASIQK